VDQDLRDPSRRDRRKLLPRQDGGRRAGDPPGFHCPFCPNKRTRVCDSTSRPNRQGYQRRRYCMDCGKKFWTFEGIDSGK
jgi:hypothetical protein